MRNQTAFAIVLFTLALNSFASDDPHTIIQRSVKANAADWKAAPDYDCYERDQIAGKRNKTYEDLMIMGSPYQKLVAVDSKPLSRERQQEEQQKLAAAIVQRRNESPSERADRIANYEKERQRDHLLMQQLTKAFDFTMVGQRELDGYEVYVLKAMPRADYQPPNMEARVLRGMQGKLWIDKKTFQWVKVEARVIHPVSIEGFLAKVEPGTRFELEKVEVADGIWLPKYFAMRAHAKVLFFFHHNSQEEDTYYGYRKTAAVQDEQRKD
jgi:hypothetical protein